MVLPSSPLGGADEQFDAYDAFVPEHIPDPGPALDDHDVLTGRRHVAFHRLTRELFEERAVYDMTFTYNLARLNLDSRHENAGYRYAAERAGAVDGDEGEGDDDDERIDDGAVPDGRVLRAEFTPTTPFCPQTHTLTKGSFRAWNGLADRHEYDLVRVRVAPMHHRAAAINAELRALEQQYLDTGTVPSPDGTGEGAAGSTDATEAGDATGADDASGVPDDALGEGPSRGGGAPF